MSSTSWSRTYLNFSIALLAPILLFYLIVVLPSFITSDSADKTTIIILDESMDNTTIITLEDSANGTTTIVLSEGSDSGDDTFFERVLPSDLFIVAGLFTYPGAMVFYFLYRKDVNEDFLSFEGEIKRIKQGIDGSFKELNKLFEKDPETIESEDSLAENKHVNDNS